MTIHKPGLVLGGSTTADGHGVLVDYEDGNDVDLGWITIGLGGPHVPAAQVKCTQNGIGEDVYTFSGSILVWAHFSGGNQSQVINCPNQEVVVTLHR